MFFWGHVCEISGESLDEAMMHRRGRLGEGRITASRPAMTGGGLRALLIALMTTTALSGAGRAETIGGALGKAYLNNPDINAQRAAVRQSDENVPIANSGYLPKINATGTLGVAHTNLVQP